MVDQLGGGDNRQESRCALLGPAGRRPGVVLIQRTTCQSHVNMIQSDGKILNAIAFIGIVSGAM